MDILGNMYVMAALCFLLVLAAGFAVLALPGLPHVGMIIVLVGVLLARFIPNRIVKSFCYLALGFVSFWGAGNALFVPIGQEAQLFSFIPFIVLGMANAGVALAAYNDGSVSGVIFAFASVFALLLTKGPLDTGGMDRLFITALAFAVASAMFALFASWAKGVGWAVYNALKAAIAAGLVYGLVYALRVFDIGVLNFSKPGDVLSMVAPVVLNTWWASLVSSFFAVAIILCIYELGLYLLNLRREPHGETVFFSRPGEEVKAEADPYKDLLAKAQKFFEEFSSYDQESAAKALAELETKYYALSKRRDSPLKANVGRILMEARGLLLGARLEVTAAKPAAAEEKLTGKKEEKPFEIPEGMVVLVEGPIGSRKEEFCLDALKKCLDAKEKCMIVSFDPKMEAGYTGESELLSQVRVEQNVNDMAISISRALEEKPKFVFFNVLYYLVPNYNVATVSGFLGYTTKKVKSAGATAIFVMEEEMLAQQALSTIESMFDGVVEFAAADEGGKPHSHYRVKELKFRKFDSSWREYG